METKNTSKTWKSKTKGLVSKKPADYMVDKKNLLETRFGFLMLADVIGVYIG